MQDTFYIPSDDSFILADAVIKKIKNKNIKILDLGTGSGIQSKTLLENGIKKNNITASDINQEALNEVKKLGIKTRKSNLFEKIYEKYDLIIFNPPYLPEHKFDKELDITGGKIGDETIINFIQDLKEHLTPKGFSLLITSSHTPNNKWIKIAKQKNLKVNKISSKKLFFEELFVWEIMQQSL
ncbi:MAG: methyltransferase [Candidatus Pacearchaeota archaeon]